MSYDNWKTTDRDYEAQCEALEKAQEIISSNGCKECGNVEGYTEFEDIEFETWKEGKYDCFKVTATCKNCGGNFEYISAPDWDLKGKDY